MKKRVLIVVTKSNFGGAQRYCFDLATNLSQQDVEITVAFGPGPDGKPGKLSSMLFQKGIRTVLVPELTRDVRLSDDIRATRALLSLFKKERPDVVHLNSSKAGGLGALAARLAGVPRILFTSHGLPFDEKRPAPMRILIAIATWATMMLAHVTIAVSEDTWNRARRLPFLHKKITLIRNGILSPSFLSKDEARDELRTLDPELPPRTFWIGSVGELHPNKNHAAAIDALTFMESDAHLIIVGDGELRTSLAAYAEERQVAARVHFLGFVPEAAKYLRAFDCMVLSSQKEGLPYVLLEAGYAYLPVIATDIAGVRDIILSDFTGILVRPNDSKVLAYAIERVLNDARLARSFADELLKRVQKSFSLDTMLEKTAHLYTNLD